MSRSAKIKRLQGSGDHLYEEFSLEPGCPFLNFNLCAELLSMIHHYPSQQHHVPSNPKALQHPPVVRPRANWRFGVDLHVTTTRALKPHRRGLQKKDLRWKVSSISREQFGAIERVISPNCGSSFNPQAINWGGWFQRLGALVHMKPKTSMFKKQPGVNSFCTVIFVPSLF